MLDERYYDAHKPRIIALVAAALGYRLVKIDQPDPHPESKQE